MKECSCTLEVCVLNFSQGAYSVLSKGTQLLQQQVNAHLQVIIVFTEISQDRDGAELRLRSRNTSQCLHLNTTTTTTSQPVRKIQLITRNSRRRPVLTLKGNPPY